MTGWDSLVEATIDVLHADFASKEICVEVISPWEGKNRMRIVATGVDDYVVSDMRLMNIIDRVNIFDAGNIRDEATKVAQKIFFIMQGKEPDPADLKWPPLQEKMTCIQKGTLKLLEIEPVYGAYILILSKSFNLEPLLGK